MAARTSFQVRLKGNALFEENVRWSILFGVLTSGSALSHAGTFHLGKVYTYVNGTIAVCWVFFITALFVIPTVRPHKQFSALAHGLYKTTVVGILHVTEEI